MFGATLFPFLCLKFDATADYEVSIQFQVCLRRARIARIKFAWLSFYFQVYIIFVLVWGRRCWWSNSFREVKKLSIKFYEILQIAETNVDNKDLIDTAIIVTKAIQSSIICDSRRGDSDTDMETGCLTFAVIIHSLIFQIIIHDQLIVQYLMSVESDCCSQWIKFRLSGVIRKI